MKLKNNTKLCSYLVTTLLLVLIPTISQAQVNPGDVITTDLTLTADLDASGYSGPALRVGASNITIDGAGFTITVNGNNTGVDVANYHGVTIQNVTVISSAAGQGTGVSLNNSSNSTVQNTSFSGLNIGIYTAGAGSNNTVNNNDFSGTNTGIASHHYGNNLHWTVTNNDFTGTAGWAMQFRGTLAELDGNDFTGAAYALALDGHNPGASNPFVMTWQGSTGPNKNTFGGHTQAVIQLANSFYIDISGWDFTTLWDSSVDIATKQGLNLNTVHYSNFANNDFSGFGTGIYTSGAGQRDTVNNNDFSGTNTGIASHHYGNNLHWTVTNNDFTGTAGWAMQFRGTLAELDGNDFTGAAYALALDGHNPGASNPFVMTWQGSTGPNKNTFGDHTGLILSFSNSFYINIDGWDFPALYAAGVDISTKQGLSLNTVHYSTFSNNILSGFSTGIYTQGTNHQNVIHGNDLSNNGSGISSNAHNCNNVSWTITDNDFTGSASWAIASFGGPNQISGNDFTGSGHGIYLRSASNKTYDLSTNIWDLADAATAFSIEYSANTTIENLNIVGDGGTGVYVGWNTSNIVVDSLETCGDLGVNLNRGSGHTVRNSSFANAGTGIHIQYANNAQIQDNSFFDITNEVSGDVSTATISGSQTVTSAPWCPAPPNTLPVADAGADQDFTIQSGTVAVTLDGSSSSDADGDPLTYTWDGAFGTATGVSPTVALGWGYHGIALTVSDGTDSATDTVSVSVVSGLPQADIVRTPWQMNRGQGWSLLDSPLSSHGELGAYANASVPLTSDSNWEPAPDPNVVGFSETSILPGYCLEAVDYTYFQTFVNVPIGASITQFTIEFSGIDDGGRVTIFNADYPGGLVIAGSYVFLGGTGTANLASYVAEGENRVVVTQVDDCPTGNNLHVALVVLNGQTVGLENEAPIADAGEDQLIESLTGSETVSLSGAGSSDGDGDNLSYSWMLNGVEESQDESFQTTLGIGVHTFTLTVDDGNGGTDSDDIVISIIDPLIAYWKAEGNGVDETLNNNDVSSAGSGAVTYGIGADGQGFEFTGSNWMEIPDNPTLDIGSGDLAIVMWAKLSGASGIETLLDKRDPNDGWRGYVVYTINDGFVGAQINVGNSYTNWISPINIADNQWHHIVFTIDRDNPTGGYITVDGTQTYTFDPTAYQGNVDNAGSLRIGGRNDGIENWVGSIDDVRLYNHAFTPTEIEDDFDNVTPPVNAAPVAVAGDDQSFTCVVGSQEVTLDGSASSDPDGDALTYSWKLAGSEVSTAAAFTTSLAAGSYTYTLTVDDGNGETNSDEVAISIVADTEPPTLTLLGDNPLNLNIHNAYDEAGYETSDACSSTVIVEVSGTVNVEIPAAYTLTYTATDSAGNETIVERVVTVINTAPVAAAGDDQTIECVIGSVDVTLNGSASSDSDGDALTYSWSLNGSEVSTTASFTASLVEGSYTYALTVSDGFDSSSDEVLVTVAFDTEPPVITLLGDNPMNLGLYLTYTEAGYETVDACGSAVTVEVTGTVNINAPGSDTLTYTATDAGGNFSSIDRIVEVFNTAPTVVNAISDFQLSFGDEFLSTEFDLAAVFTDVDIYDVLTYSFTNSNGSAASVALSGSLINVSALDLGVTIIELTATDHWGASVTHEIAVTVDVTPVLADAVVFGIRQAELKKRTQVFSGNILVNGLSIYCDYNQDDNDGNDHGGGGHGGSDHGGGDHGGGYGFNCSFAGNLRIDRDVEIAGGYQVHANCISLQRNTVINSDVYYNFLDNNRGDIYGDEYSPIDVPLFTTLPPFKSAPAGTDNITVNKNQSLSLAPGDYGKIKVKKGGELTLNGGVYNVKSIKLDKRAELNFDDAAEIRVKEKVENGKQTYIGPSNNAFIDASDIIFYVSGLHGNDDDDDDDDDYYGWYCDEPGHGHNHGDGHSDGHPRKVVKVEQQSMVFANFYAPDHKIELHKNVDFTGALYAWDVKVDQQSDVTLDSYFNIYDSGLAKQVAWSKPSFEWLPEEYVLEQNYPNPFNPSTTISYAIPNDGMVSLKIYNLLGQEVANLVNEIQESGYHQVIFEAGHLSSGVYLAVMQSAEFVDTRKIILIK